MKTLKLSRLPCLVTACLIISTSLTTYADENDEEEMPFDEAELFFELNNTDGDLGIHGKVDGDEWMKLTIEDPMERKMLILRVKGRLKQQGLTELFFESAEPTFDELDPNDFFHRFPEGLYEIEGKTLDGEEMEGEVFLSHVMPAPAHNVLVSGAMAAPDCDSDLPLVSPPIVISWDPVVGSHPELGIDGDIDVDYYELVVENEDEELVMSTMLPADITELTVPDGFIELADEFKFEILVRAENGNKTAIESCFEIY